MTSIVRCKVDSEQYKKGNEEQQESLLGPQIKTQSDRSRDACCLPRVSPNTPVSLYTLRPTHSFHAI